MAIVKSWGVSSLGTSADKPVWLSDWDGNYAPVSKTAGNTVVTNTTAPLDQPLTIRTAVQDIANIYNGTKVDPAYLATSKRGRSVLSQVNAILSIRDSDNPAFRVDLPVSGHTVLRVPTVEWIGYDEIAAILSLLAGTWFNTDGTTRIPEMFRGGTTPGNL